VARPPAADSGWQRRTRRPEVGGHLIQHELLQSLGARFGLPPVAPTIRDPAEIDRLYRLLAPAGDVFDDHGVSLFLSAAQNLSMAAKPIIDEFHFSNTQWGLVLSIATIVYAFSKFLSGIVGDRANPKYLMGGGLLLSAMVSACFGFGSGLAPSLPSGP